MCHCGRTSRFPVTPVTIFKYCFSTNDLSCPNVHRTGMWSLWTIAPSRLYSFVAAFCQCKSKGLSKAAATFMNFSVTFLNCDFLIRQSRNASFNNDNRALCTTKHYIERHLSDAVQLHVSADCWQHCHIRLLVWLHRQRTVDDILRSRMRGNRK